MANPSINLGNGNWSVKESKLLGSRPIKDKIAPIEFDVTRASTATRVNKQGLIETVNSNIARIDYSNDANGALLLEPQSTNLVTYSEDFSDSSWTKTGNTVVTLNSDISPDGTLNASTVTGLDGTGTNDLYTQPTFNSSNKTVTYSVYLKGSGTLRINVSNNVDDSSSKTLTLTNNWKRYFITYSFNASTSTELVCNLDDLSATATTYEVWGAQAEELSYATSYIPTSGTTQTRVAETCGGAGDSSSINSEEGVLYFNIATLVNTQTADNSITLTDGGNNKIIFRYRSTNAFNVKVFVNGVAQAEANHTLSNATDFNNIAVKWKLNDYEIYVNGISVFTNNNALVFPSNSINNLSFADGTSTPFYGNVKDLRVYNTALTDAELQALTTL